MRLGVRTPGLPVPPEEKFALAPGLGLTGVQMAPAEFAGTDPGAAAQLRKTARAHGPEISGTTAGPNLVDPVGLEERIQKFRHFFRLSVALGSGLVTGEVKAKPIGLSEDAAWESVLYAVQGVVRLADEQGGVTTPHGRVGDWRRGCRPSPSGFRPFRSAVPHSLGHTRFPASPRRTVREVFPHTAHRSGSHGAFKGSAERCRGAVHIGVEYPPGTTPTGGARTIKRSLCRHLRRPFSERFDGRLCVKHCRSAAARTAAVNHLRGVYPVADG